MQGIVLGTLNVLTHPILLPSPRRQSHYCPYMADSKLKHKGKKLAQGHWTIKCPGWDSHICSLAQSVRSHYSTADVQSGQSNYFF